MSPITLEQAQQTVDDWIKSVGVRHFSEMTHPDTQEILVSLRAELWLK